MRGGSGGGGRGTCGARLSVAFFVLGRVSERNSIGTLIDGSDSDLNWLFSAPITGWGIRGNRTPAGRAAPSRPKSHLIRKSDESRDENGDSSGLGRFYGSLSRRAASHQIKFSRSERRRRRRDARGKLRFDGRSPLPHPPLKRRRFRVKNCLLRFENLTCTTTDRCDRHPVA